MKPKKRIVVVGGGTGTFTVLSGLKKFANLDLCAIVSMTDSGGSNKVIRDQFGLLPTSDIRQCILALCGSNTNAILRKLFTYRYNQGTGITGMTFGNLFMAALSDIYGSQKKAIAVTCDMFGVTGCVLPVTLDDGHLLAIYENGREVLGEHQIDETNEINEKSKIIDLKIIPKVRLNSEVKKVLKAADLIVLGPGDLYTSIICNLIVPGFPEALDKSQGKIVFVANLMTRDSQTKGFSASDHLAEINKFLGKRKVDIALLNNKKIAKPAISWYKKWGMAEVVDDLDNGDLTVVRKNLVSSKVYQKDKADKLTRSLVRHDQSKLAKAIIGLL